MWLTNPVTVGTQDPVRVRRCCRLPARWMAILSWDGYMRVNHEEQRVTPDSRNSTNKDRSESMRHLVLRKS